jgi:hypothetical protein
MRSGEKMTFARKQLYYIFLIVLFALVFSSIGNVTRALGQTVSGIVHFPVKSASEGRNILIEAKIENPTVKVQYIRLYFRQKGQSNFQQFDMDEQLDSFIGQIPASEVKIPGVEYFIMVVLRNQTMMTSPSSNPYYAPYEITINASKTPEYTPEKPKPAFQRETISAKDGVNLKTIILSPEPNERIPSDEVVIAISLLGDVSSVDLKSVQLFIDNRKFTAQTKISPYMISLALPNLTSGAHDVRVELSDRQGNRFDDVQWQFIVISNQDNLSQQKSSLIEGNAYAEWKNENISDSTLTTQNIGANFNGSYGSIHYRGMAFFTSREKPGFQPRNRMLLEVGTSWIGVKFGDTTPQMNELMLWGRRVRGIEAYLKLGFINLEFVQGEINREIEGVPYDITINDTTGEKRFFIPNTKTKMNSTTGIYRYGTFKQNILAIRPSFGGGKNFQFGLNLIKVRDDTSSIKFGAQPKDNLVIGPDFLLAFDNHRIELKASAAFSLLANDISNGAVTQSELDSAIGEVPFDPSDFEEYFILNTSLIPFDPSKLNSLAYQASFKFNYFNNNIYVIYKSVGSEFYSLANNFLRKDIKGFSIYDRVRLYRNQIYLNLGYDQYSEGLSYEDDGEDGTEPTAYSALNIGIAIYPRRQYLPKINVSWKNYDRDNTLDINDTPYAVSYQNKDVAVQLGYDAQFLNLNHTFNISYITTDRIDGFNQAKNDLANDIRMLSIRTVYQVPLTTVISYATNQNNAAGITDFKYNMFNLSADYSLLDRRLNLRSGINITSAVGTLTQIVDSLGTEMKIQSDYTDYNRTAFTMGGSFAISRQHSLLLDMSFINFDDKKTKQYNDSIIRFRYEFRY